MKISIIAVGSRGDLQPYIALGLGFKKSGHEVTIVAFQMYESWVLETGLQFQGFKGDIKSWLNTPVGLDWLEAGANPFAFIKGLKILLADFLEDLWIQSLDAASKSDLILFTPLGLTARHVAEAHNIPALPVFYVPHYPTRTFPSVLSPPSPFQLGWLNRVSHYGSEWALWHSCKDAIQRFRKQVGLPKFEYSKNKPFTEDTPYLMGYSEHVSPRAIDWPDHVQSTGYWFLDQSEGWTPPDDLQQFLSDGPAPVYIGFGSMTGRKNKELTQQILQGLASTGTRALLLTGWGALTQDQLQGPWDPNQVFFLENAPHDWLFPKMKAVVHHGGAGTTSSGFRAGTPQWVIPHFADQFFWGERVHSLGCGPKPVSRKKVCVSDWVKNLKDLVENPNYRVNAHQLAEQIQSEDGVGRAVEIIERWYGSQSNSKEEYSILNAKVQGH